MFLNTLKYFLRNVKRHKLFSFINVTGLAFSIGFLILIGQFIYFEYNYNRNVSNVENIYRLVDSTEKNYGIDYRIQELISDRIPDVKNSCVMNSLRVEINIENEIYTFKNSLMVDNKFFSLFNIEFISGNPSAALSSQNSIVLTESTAKRIFNSTNVVGSLLKLDHEYDMIITGVVKDLSSNFSFQGDLFVSYENTKIKRISYKQSCLTFDGVDDSKCKYPYNIFVELNDKAEVFHVEKKISLFNKINNYRYPESIFLRPLKDNYFNSEFVDDTLQHGNSSLIKILIVIGILILTLAVFNYINLTTAGYKYRLKEIGIKKTIGVNRRHLTFQFLLETLFLCILAASLGLLIAELFLPYFNQFIEKKISLQILTDFDFFLLLVAFILFLAFTAGIIPSLLLSRISPLHLFNLQPYLKNSGKTYRNLLVVFQFVITTSLIFGLIVITRQIDFVKHKNLGFNSENLLSIGINYKMRDKANVLYNKLREYHDFTSVTSTFGIPGKIYMSMNEYKIIMIDSTSLNAFGFKLIDGRNLLPGDFNRVCFINEEGFKNLENKDYRTQNVNGLEIIGVVSDFHYGSLHNKIGKMALMYSNNAKGNYITMRLNGNLKNALNYIERTWEEIVPGYPLEIEFFDDQFAAMYRKEENFASLVTIFSVLAIIISCLGIFGLAFSQSEERIKEIGIRKVMGATSAEIVLLLTRNFSKWVIVATIIALPIAYYFMLKWLQNFVYKIEIGFIPFFLSSIVVFVIALGTIGVQSAKAALANPVDSLRNE